MGDRFGAMVNRVVLVVALALVVVHSDSRAGDDADQRKELLAQIEDKVEDMAESLERLPGDSSERPINDASALAYDIKRLAGQLAEVIGDDDTAKRIAATYPEEMDAYQQLVPSLRALKQGQRHAEPEAQMCSERDKELSRQANDYEARNDPDGLTELPKLAAHYQEASKQALDGSRRDDDQLEGAKDDAEDYSADGDLRQVDSALATSSLKLYVAGHKTEEAAEAACANLLKGVDHPEVKDALSRLGNSAGGRKAIIEQLAKDLATFTSSLQAVAGDPGTGSVDKATAALGAIEHGVKALGATSTAEKESKRIVEQWPAIITAASVALNAIAELNEHHHVLDPLPDRCKHKERELDEFIAHNDDDSDGLEIIPSYAAGVGDLIDRGLTASEERLKKMAAAQERAKRFKSSEGLWASVESSMTSSASTMYAHFEDKQEETAAACQDLRKGAAHPKVKTALDKLRANSGSAIDVLTVEVKQWVVESKATYRLDCEAMQAMWAAYCTVDYEEHEAPDDEPAKRIAQDRQSAMRAVMEPLIVRGTLLRGRATALAAKRETKAVATALGRDLDKEDERLTRLFPSGVWRGVNDPLQFYSTEYGKAAHRRKTAEFQCDAHDVTFTGLDGKRPDCVRGDHCTIYEFKPNNDAAVEDGETQLKGYVALVTAYYQKHLDDKSTPDDAHGGADILTAFEKSGCVTDKRLALKTEVEPYAMCEKKYWCVEN